MENEELEMTTEEMTDKKKKEKKPMPVFMQLILVVVMVVVLRNVMGTVQVFLWAILERRFVWLQFRIIRKFMIFVSIF